MTRIAKNADFLSTLASLPVQQQRQLGARFIAGVIQLANSPRLNQALDLLMKPSCSEEDLNTAYAIARAVYVETSPGSDIAEFEMNCQAIHFVAQAAVICSAPVKQATAAAHLGQKVANYCRMAQTCLSIGHGGDTPDFAGAEEEYNRVMNAQFEVVNQFLASQAA